jgi:ADP-ribose pyrophosphatase YjhB (NUDIX family)
MTFLSKIVMRGLRVYWRATRSIALAVEACVIDAEYRIALVKADAKNGWRLPRTRVRKGEALDDALRRFLMEDYRIRIVSRPDLFWMFGESVPEPEGLTGLYVVRRWRQDVAPAASDLSFFGLDALPAGLPSRDAARIRQAVEGRAPFEVC